MKTVESATMILAAGFVWRDLKLENVLIQRSGHVALADFDLAGAWPPVRLVPPVLPLFPKRSFLGGARVRSKGATLVLQLNVIHRPPHPSGIGWAAHTLSTSREEVLKLLLG